MNFSHPPTLADLDALPDGRWTDAGVFCDKTEAQIPPFDAAPIDVLEWWAGDEAPPPAASAPTP